LCGPFFAPIIRPEAEEERKGDHAMKGPVVRTDAILSAPDYTQGVVLAAGVAQNFDAPAGVGFVNFAFNTDIWVRYNGTAVIPTSSTTLGSSSPEFNPTMRNISSTAACTGVSVISPTTGAGSIAWYKPA